MLCEAKVELPSEQSIQKKMDALIDGAPFFDDRAIKYAEKQVLKGVKHHSRGRYRKAIQYYRRALDRVPLFGSAYYELALAHYSLKQYSAAYSNVVRALVMEPGSEMAHIVKASILDDAGYHDSAIELLKRLVDINPEGYLARLNLGITQLKQGRFAQAEQSFMEASEVDPSNPSSFYFLFICGSQQGFNYDEEKWINQFLEVAAKDDFRRQLVIKRLEELTSKAIYIDPESRFPQLDLIENMARRKWATKKHRETYPNERGYKPSLAEEMNVAEILMGFANQRSSEEFNRSERIKMLRKLHALGYLKAFFYLMLREQLGEKDLHWGERNQQIIDNFLVWQQSQRRL